MAKLNQILAIEHPIKAAALSGMTEKYHQAKKHDSFVGLTKEYHPRDDDGDTLPSEKKLVINTSTDLLADSLKEAVDWWTITARKDWTNTVATADLVVDGKTLIAGAPSTFLIWFEKRVVEIRNIIDAIPVLDPAEKWNWDEATGQYRTDPTKQVKTKKVEKALVLYDATDKHPAQVKTTTDDIQIGDWTQVKLSGAMKKADKAAMMERINTLSLAVKQARETANLAEEIPTPSLQALSDYILGA